MDEREKRKKQQEPMLLAADQFLRDADALVASAAIKPQRLEVEVAYSLYARIMQLGRVLLFLARNGYADEAKPIARAAAGPT